MLAPFAMTEACHTRFAYQVPKAGSGPLARFSEQGLEAGKGFLDRVEAAAKMFGGYAASWVSTGREQPSRCPAYALLNLAQSHA